MPTAPPTGHPRGKSRHETHQHRTPSPWAPGPRPALGRQPRRRGAPCWSAQNWTCCSPPPQAPAPCRCWRAPACGGCGGCQAGAAPGERAGKLPGRQLGRQPRRPAALGRATGVKPAARAAAWNMPWWGASWRGARLRRGAATLSGADVDDTLRSATSSLRTRDTQWCVCFPHTAGVTGCQCLAKVCATRRGKTRVASALSFTGRASVRILPQDTASSGRAPLSEPSNSWAVLT